MKTFTQAIYADMQKEYRQMFATISKKEHLSKTEIRILAVLANHPECHTAKDIIRLQKISKAQTSIAIEKLVKKGLIKREVNKNNRRYHLLYIEKKADNIIKKILFQQQLYIKKAYQNMSENEIKTYYQLLTNIYDNLKGEQK